MSVRSSGYAREQRVARSLTLAELVEEYLEQHDAEPVTIAKLRWLLGKAIAVFGEMRLSELHSQEIAAWRMTIPPGHRFAATQALRQVLARAVVWGMIDVNPAKQRVDNPQRRRTEKRPFESWAELEAIAARLGPRYGPIVIFAAATGLRPGEWIALEHRDIDLDERVAYIRRALTRLWKPAQLAAGIEPLRRVYDLRHTFATFALRAGISTFDLSRYMGASLTMIDRHYGHLARDGREHAIRLLDDLNVSEMKRWTFVDAGWTPKQGIVAHRGNAKRV